MKNIPANLKNLLNNEIMNFFKCYKITLTNNTIFCFTEYTKEITIDGLQYKHSNGIELTSKLNNKNDLSYCNSDLFGFVDNEIIKISDINSGKFNNATINIFLINPDNINEGSINLLDGIISSITLLDNNVYYFNINSIGICMENTIGETFSPLCRCQFCDSKCGLQKTLTNGTISNIINQFEFETETLDIVNKAPKYYNDGIIEMLSGANAGLKTEIKNFNSGYFLLKLNFPFELQVNDSFSVLAGCDKNFKTCCEKFNNAINFRGEPKIPRTEKIMKVY